MRYYLSVGGGGGTAGKDVSEQVAQYLQQLAEQGEREPPQHLSVMSDAAINGFIKEAAAAGEG